jgi:hypothetical protein
MLFNKNQIPNTIDTYEKLAVWLGSILRASMPSQALQEREPNQSTSDSGIQRHFETIGPVTAANGEIVFICRQTIPVQNDWSAPAYTAIWDAAKPVANVNPVANMIQA